MVYICVLNYNNPLDTIACLDSLISLSWKEYKILLVDNSSTDNSFKILSDYVAKKNYNIIFFTTEHNSGYAAGNNVALRYAMQQEDMEYCWILNNDTTVEKDSLDWLVKHMREHIDVGLCGSKLVYSWDKSCVQGYGGLYVPWLATSSYIGDEKDISKMDFVIGASVFVSRKFLEQIGLMCEDYFLYFEELDWAERAKGKFKLSCEPRSVVYHKEGAVVGADALHPEDKSEMADYFCMRNRLLFTLKFYPYYLPTVYLSSFVMIWNSQDMSKFVEGSDIVLAPVRIGGGIRLKILEAMARGRPMISTPIGMEGNNGMEAVIIANTPEEYCTSILTLLNNNDMWNACVIKGRKYVEDNYSVQLLANKIKEDVCIS